MREINLDLSADLDSVRYEFAGFEGEHLETRLTVKLPDRLLEEGRSYRFLFETAAGEAVTSAPLQAVEGEVSLLLPAALLRAPRLTAQVVCYGEEEQKPVAKSRRLVLRVAKSVAESDVPFQSGTTPVPGLTVDAALSDESRNPLENRAVTAALKEKIGPKQLCYAAVGIRDEQHASDGLVPTEKAVAAALAILEEETECAFEHLEERMLTTEEEPDAESLLPLTNGASCTLFSPALKGHAQGNPVCLTDVSKLAHLWQVQCHGGETVTVSGKNLFDPSVLEMAGMVLAEDGYYRGKANPLHDKYHWREGTLGSMYNGFLPNTQYAFRMKGRNINQGSNVNGSVGFYFRYSDGTNSPAKYLFGDANDPDADMTISFCSDAAKSVTGLHCSTSYNFDILVKEFQLEVAAAPTEYEPFLPPVTYPVEEGELRLAALLAPTAVLSTEAGASLTVAYNKDVNRVIERLTQAILSLGGSV